MSKRIVQTTAAVCLLLAGIATAQTGNSSARDFWNEKFRSGLPNVRREPSLILVEALKEHPAKAGSTALDLGCGEGRNLLYLAGNGWSVTGVDVSEVGIGQAREALTARNLKGELLVADLGAFDLGENRWDLLTSIYMQDWHLKSKTNTFQRMKQALRPGGLVVIEGFGTPNALNLDLIRREFEGFAVLRAEVTAGDPDWGKGRGAKAILRFVARRNP